MRCALASLVVVVCCAATAGAARRDAALSYTAAAQRDLVDSLPGWGPVDSFNLFSGYITVHEAKQRRLFYVLVESEEDPDTAPLVLWLNGGPGCSSVGGGFLTEMGPWYPRQDRSLKANPHSWNKWANMLFVEAPAFVGFSYSNDKRDADVGDSRTASDNLAFLLGFFERFPRLADNKLWVAGESYAGHYVPQLALQIVWYNKCVSQRRASVKPGGQDVATAPQRGGQSQQQQEQGRGDGLQQQQEQGRGYGRQQEQQQQQGEEWQQREARRHVNRSLPLAWNISAKGCAEVADLPGGGEQGALRLEGLSLGNAWTDPVLDNRGTVDHWWTHSMISDTSFAGIKRYCDFAASNPLDPHPDHNNPQSDDDWCDIYCHLADQEIGSVDIYNVIEDSCTRFRARGEVEALGRALRGTRAGLGVQAASRKGTSAAVQHLLWLRNQSLLPGSSSGDGAAQTFTAGSSHLGESYGAAAFSSVAVGGSRRMGLGAARWSGAAQGGGVRLGYEARKAPNGAGGRGKDDTQTGGDDQSDQQRLPQPVLLDQLRQSDKDEVEMVGAAQRHQRSGVTQQGRGGERDGEQEERAVRLQQQQRPLLLQQDKGGYVEGNEGERQQQQRPAVGQQGEGDLREGERDADGAEQAAKAQVLQQPTLERQDEGGHDEGEREAEKARVLQQLRGRGEPVWSAEQLRGYEPCVEDYGEAYLNMPEVQRALHANQSADWVPWPWRFCHSAELRYQREDLQLSMLPLYDQILDLAPSLRILLYSGDADASVPTLGTRYWLMTLNLREKGRTWSAWRSSTGQVAGYFTEFKELSFATVRAAGHMVPYSQPERASFLVSSFVQGRPLSD